MSGHVAHHSGQTNPTPMASANGDPRPGYACSRIRGGASTHSLTRPGRRRPRGTSVGQHAPWLPAEMVPQMRLGMLGGVAVAGFHRNVQDQTYSTHHEAVVGVRGPSGLQRIVADTAPSWWP